MFIDKDQLKGKPMQNLVKNIVCGSRDLNEHFTNCYDYDYSAHLRSCNNDASYISLYTALPLALMCIIVMRYAQCSLHAVHVHYNNGPRHANLSSRLPAMLR